MRRHLADNRRFLPLVLLTLLIIAIAVSRVWLHAHTTAEVLAGLAAGAISLFISYFLILRGKTTAPFDAYALALWAVVAAFIVHGTRFPAEHIIRMLALHIKGHMPFCG
jgi:membrane-associated phospholipid phosphatase